MKSLIILLAVAAIVFCGFSFLKPGKAAVQKLNEKRHTAIEQVLEMEK